MIAIVFWIFYAIFGYIFLTIAAVLLIRNKNKEIWGDVNKIFDEDDNLLVAIFAFVGIFIWPILIIMFIGCLLLKFVAKIAVENPVSTFLQNFLKNRT